MSRLETDVLVVGAGPAGLAAAIELRKLGVSRVLVVDREKQAGGIPRHCHHIGFGLRDMYRFLTGPAYAARYVRLAQAQGVTIETETTITGWDDAHHLTATQPSGLAEIEASAVVLATGCRERPRAARLVPGSRPAGVFTTGALQNFAYVHHHPIGSRAVIVGADHVGFSAVLTLKHAGVDVIAMVTELPRHQSYFAYKLVSADRYRVPIHTDIKVTGIFGKKRVEAVELTHVHDGSVQRIACDTLVFTGDWIPDHELSFAGGAEIDPQSKSPRVDLGLHTSVEGVFAAGNLIHAAETADVAALSGRVAAHSVKEYLRTGNWITREPLSIAVDAPIVWVSPHIIRPGQTAAPHSHFILRVADLLKHPTLVVKQGQRTLWQQRYREMIPNLPVHVSDHWLPQVEPAAGPICFEVVSG